MTFEEQLNAVLVTVQSNYRILTSALRSETSLNGVNITQCLNKLVKDGYIKRTWNPGQTDKHLQLTSTGILFIENGGYGAISKFEQQTLNIAKKSMHISIVAVIIAGIAIVTSVILWYLSK